MRDLQSSDSDSQFSRSTFEILSYQSSIDSQRFNVPISTFTVLNSQAYPVSILKHTASPCHVLPITRTIKVFIEIVRRGRREKARYRAISEWLQLAKRFLTLEIFLFPEVAGVAKAFTRAYRDSRSSVNEIVGR